MLLSYMPLCMSVCSVYVRVFVVPYLLSFAGQCSLGDVVFSGQGMCLSRATRAPLSVCALDSPGSPILHTLDLVKQLLGRPATDHGLDFHGGSLYSLALMLDLLHQQVGRASAHGGLDLHRGRLSLLVLDSDHLEELVGGAPTHDGLDLHSSCVGLLVLEF